MKLERIRLMLYCAKTAESFFLFGEFKVIDIFNLYTIRAALIKSFSALGLRCKAANSLANRNLL